MGMPETNAPPFQQQMVYGSTKSLDPAHQVVDYLGDKLGYGWLLLLLVIGALYFFRKKIREFFK